MTVPITLSLSRSKDFAVISWPTLRMGLGNLGIFYDVMKGDCYHGGGGAFPPCRNNEPIRHLKKKPLQEFFSAGNSGMFEDNEWVWVIWVEQRWSVSTAVRPLVFAKVLSGRLLTYITTCSHGLRCDQYLRGKVCYRLLTVSGELADFKTRQPVMMVPIEMQRRFSLISTKGKRTKCKFQKDLLKR